MTGSAIATPKPGISSAASVSSTHLDRHVVDVAGWNHQGHDHLDRHYDHHQRQNKAEFFRRKTRSQPRAKFSPEHRAKNQNERKEGIDRMVDAGLHDAY